MEPAPLGAGCAHRPFRASGPDLYASSKGRQESVQRAVSSDKMHSETGSDAQQERRCRMHRGAGLRDLRNTLAAAFALPSYPSCVHHSVLMAWLAPQEAMGVIEPGPFDVSSNTTPTGPDPGSISNCTP